MADPAHDGPATFADLLALPESVRAEVIEGVVVPRAAPRFEHSDAQSAIDTEVRVRFRRPPGDGDRPGGWWIVTEAEVEYETHEVYRHDVAGWRRERVPERPSGRPVRIRTDWACEVLSPSNAANDTVRKFRTLHRCGVPFYWIVDVEHGTITVPQWQESGYLTVVVGQRGETLRLPPFDAVELDVGVLLGNDPVD